MSNKLKSLWQKNELYISITILILCFIIELRSGQFFTSNNLVDIASALIVPGLFAVGAFIVIVSGGIDVSFPALASLSVYITTRILTDINFKGSILVPIIMVVFIGMILGALNGFLIAEFKLPALIITLGTQSVFRGIMQGVLGSVQIPNIPEPMKEFGTTPLFIAKNQTSGLTSTMPVAVIALVVVIAAIYFLLNFTMFGRGIFAIGGNETSAERAGFNVKLIKFFTYVIVGAIASLAGLIRVCMMGQCHPTNLLGMEMMVIASVVLGGTAIAGGAGTLTGAMLGTILIVIVENSLILLGVPTYWQGFFLGMLIIVGTGVSAYQVMRANKQHLKVKDA